jgi:hypothetical protein
MEHENSFRSPQEPATWPHSQQHDTSSHTHTHTHTHTIHI